MDETLRPAAEAVWDMTIGCALVADPLQLHEALSAADLERLLSRARAAIIAPVLEIHRPCHHEGTQPWGCEHGHYDDAFETGIPDRPAVCVECTDGNEDHLPYPCPTVRALGVTNPEPGRSA